MSDIKISEFPTIVGQVTGNEFVPLLQGGVNKKAALSQLGLPVEQTTVTPGPYGTASSVGSFVVNNYGSLTSAANVSIAIDTSQVISGVFDITRGGTGNSAAPSNGQMLIGNGSGYTLATLTAGTNVTISNAAGGITINAADQFTGTVTSVDVSGGTTGLSTTGGPVTTSGTITLSGILTAAHGGTGTTALPTNGQLLIGNGTGYTLANLTAGGTVTITEGAGSINISAADQYTGTVTSVGFSGGTTGLTISGTSPITTSGTFTLEGTLITSNGGTGLTTYTAGDMVYYASGTTLSKLAIGTNSYVLTSNGTAPQWTDPTTISFGSASSATNLAGGSANDLVYQSATGTTAFLNTGSGVLVASGGAPSWSQTPTLTSVSLTSGTVSTAPTSGTDLVNKTYVDTLVSSGITYHSPVKYEVPNTTGNLNATYNNGTAGVGATLTNAGTLGAFTPDGIAAQVGDRILIYNQTNQFENGVYEVTTVGDGSTAWVLTRTTDTDSYGLKDPNALGEGDAFFITSGNTGAGETYVCNTTGTITFGTTAITFTQVSSAQVYSAGTGLTLTGTQFSLTSPVTAVLGGTGYTSYTTGDLLYASSGTTLGKLAGVAVGNVLLSGGVATAPSWGQVGLTTHVTGILPIANGGTNTSDSPLAGAVAYGTGSAYAFTTAGTAGQVLLSNGSSAPAFGGIDGGTF